MTFRTSFLLFCLFASTITAPYITIKSLAEIQNHLSEPKKTIVFLDLDHTVVRSKMSPGWLSKLKFLLWPSKDCEINSIFDRVHFCYTLIPHEDNTVEIINALKDQSVIVVGLTARPPIIADRTLEQLQSLKLTFSTDSFKQDSIELPHGAYKGGIIFCGTHDKGTVMTEFLQETNIEPKKIIFADDLRKNVCSVECAAEKLGVTCCALHIV